MMLTKNLGFLLVLVLWTFPLFASEAVLKFHGDAKLNDGSIFYTEFHHVTLNNGQILKTHTDYKDKSGKLIAELDADFSRSQTRPDSTFVDHRDQYKCGLKSLPSGSEVETYRQDSPSAKIEKKNIAITERTIALQGALNFVLQNLGKILAGEKLEMEMIVPSQLQSYEMTAKVDGSPKSKSQNLNVELSPRSVFARLLVHKTTLIINQDTKKWLGFEGVSNLLDEKDHPQTVKISYMDDP